MWAMGPCPASLPGGVPPPHPRGLSVARALWGAGVLPQWQHGGRGGAGGEWEFQHPQGCTHLASHQRDNPSDPP